ncbi:cysteine ABC transporter substrate-binding protein [Neisseriaceae bacterium CLB008]|nr:cysteine ABC transporter substrate-binding protein [Neisseriaceae bacterium]
MTHLPFGRLLATGLLSLALLGCNAQTETATDSAPTTEASDGLQAIKDRGVLKIAVFSDKPPFGYIDEQGNNQGYDIALGKRLAKDLLGDESKVEFVLTEAQNRVDVLKSNKVDITLANFTQTPEREAQVDFALPYMKTAIGLVSPKSAPITDVAQLEGKALLVNKGTTAEIYFAKNHASVEQLKLDHNTEAFNALKDGRAAALAHDNTLLYAWVKENPTFAVSINQIGANDFIAPAVKKGNTALLNWLNDEITQLKNERFFHQAYEQTIAPFYGEGINPDNIVIEEPAQ